MVDWALISRINQIVEPGKSTVIYIISLKSQFRLLYLTLRHTWTRPHPHLGEMEAGGEGGRDCHGHLRELLWTIYQSHTHMFGGM